MPLDHLWEMEQGDLVLRCATLELVLRSLIDWSEGAGKDDFGEREWAQARTVLNTLSATKEKDTSAS